MSLTLTLNEFADLYNAAQMVLPEIGLAILVYTVKLEEGFYNAVFTTKCGNRTVPALIQVV